MRTYRRAAGLTQEEVADALRCDVSKVSYSETAARPFREKDLQQVLFRLYAVPEDDQAALLAAHRRSRSKAWWDSYDEETVPLWYRKYLGLEQGAREVNGFLLQLVPGLLQTADYARAIMTGVASALDEEEAAGRTEVRLRRQELLVRQPDPLCVHYILDEAVLRRVVGGPDVMVDQLLQLIEFGRQDHITLQVLTFKQGYYWDGKGEPAILHFPWDEDSVVYIESRLGGEFLEREADVRSYERAWDHLRRTALPPLESLAMIETVAKDHR